MSKINNGQLYEIQLNAKLVEDGLSPVGFRAAGNGSGPDAAIMYDDKEIKIEIKDRIYADFGQSTLKYNMETLRWELTGRKTAAALSMQEMLRSYGVDEFANKVWGAYGAPRKTSVPRKQFTREDAEYDMVTFQSHFMGIPQEVMHNYYRTKDTYYIQVGGYGFYHLHSDPLNLGTPQFDAKMQTRIRRKSGGNSKGIGNYRYSTALMPATAPSVVSPYNIEYSTAFLKK